MANDKFEEVTDSPRPSRTGGKAIRFTPQTIATAELLAPYADLDHDQLEAALRARTPEEDREFHMDRVARVIRSQGVPAPFDPSGGRPIAATRPLAPGTPGPRIVSQDTTTDEQTEAVEAEIARRRGAQKPVDLPAVETGLRGYGGRLSPAPNRVEGTTGLVERPGDIHKKWTSSLLLAQHNAAAGNAHDEAVKVRIRKAGARAVGKMFKKHQAGNRTGVPCSNPKCGDLQATRRLEKKKYTAKDYAAAHGNDIAVKSAAEAAMKLESAKPKNGPYVDITPEEWMGSLSCQAMERKAVIAHVAGVSIDTVHNWVASGIAGTRSIGSAPPAPGMPAIKGDPTIRVQKPKRGSDYQPEEDWMTHLQSSEGHMDRVRGLFNLQKRARQVGFALKAMRSGKGTEAKKEAKINKYNVNTGTENWHHEVITKGWGDIVTSLQRMHAGLGGPTSSEYKQFEDLIRSSGREGSEETRARGEASGTVASDLAASGNATAAASGTNPAGSGEANPDPSDTVTTGNMRRRLNRARGNNPFLQ